MVDEQWSEQEHMAPTERAKEALLDKSAEEEAITLWGYGETRWAPEETPDFDTFFTKPLILLESKNKLGTTLKVSVDYLIR